MREKLTKRDVEKIEEEIEHRKLVIRKEAIEAVKEARAQGDLSENFEYYAAKKHKNQNESRIRYLERMHKTAEVVEDTSRSDEVGMDDIVEVEFEEDGEVEIADYGVEPLVSHVTSGPEGVTTYFLENYSEELAEENDIVLQDSSFSREYCVNLCDSVWGDLWKTE